MKRRVLMILFFITTISLFGCSNEVRNRSEVSSPPTLKVSYDNKSIDAKMGTSSWTITNSDGSKTTTDTDTAGPVELVKDMRPLKAPPESTIKLDFSHEPKEVIANIWEGDSQLEQSLNDMEIITPGVEGLVIYEVIGSWEQGTVHYAFIIDVDSQ